MENHKLTLVELKSAVPKSLRGSVDEELVDKINNLTSEPELMEQYRENLISYTSVMEDGKFKMDSYIEAIKYITHKLMGKTNKDAYIATFPKRYEKFLLEGKDSNTISSYISSYNKNKLVNLIREQTLIPTHILNADYYQQAINKQAQMMNDPNVSPTVQQRAADSLIVNLKPPESAKVELSITNKANTITDDLKETLIRLASKQRDLISSGAYNPKQIAESTLNRIEKDEENIIEGELIND